MDPQEMLASVLAAMARLRELEETRAREELPPEMTPREIALYQAVQDGINLQKAE
jgi:hypothetical protein